GIGSKPAVGYGSAKLRSTVDSKITTVTLHRVLYLPSSPHNLISLGKLHRAGLQVDWDSLCLIWSGYHPGALVRF
ncbi:hypothetical protein B0H19DRAFT_955378, partial [Mycena capillaripes]